MEFPIVFTWAIDSRFKNKKIRGSILQLMLLSIPKILCFIRRLHKYKIIYVLIIPGENGLSRENTIGERQKRKLFTLNLAIF